MKAKLRRIITMTSAATHPTKMRYLFGCCVLLPLLVLSPALASADNIFLSEYSCQNSLRDADVNGDGAIDRVEYLGFINARMLPDYNSFDMLPLALQANFLSLACLCEFKTDSEEDCCRGGNAQLLVPNPLDDDQLLSWYFDEICRDTAESLATLSHNHSGGEDDENNVSSDSRRRYRTHKPSPSPIAATAMPDSSHLSIMGKSSATIASAEKMDDAGSSKAKPTPMSWHTTNRHYFIPIITLTAFILLALAFSMYITMHRRYQYQKRDKSGFVLGSFPSVLPATSTLTDRNNWNEGGCFEARSLDEQDCGISFECSYDMSDVSSRISLRSIRVPSFWLANPYSHYKPFIDEQLAEEEARNGSISPMTSEQGSDRGSDIGSPI